MLVRFSDPLSHGLANLAGSGEGDVFFSVGPSVEYSTATVRSRTVFQAMHFGIGFLFTGARKYILAVFYVESSDIDA
jgi:hypothetical protein